MFGNHSDGVDRSATLIQNSVILPIKKINTRFIQDPPPGTVYSLPRGCSHNDYWLSLIHI